jgi:hypothetical protein
MCRAHRQEGALNAADADVAGVGASADALCENFYPCCAHHFGTSTHPACDATKPQITALPGDIHERPVAHFA